MYAVEFSAYFSHFLAAAMAVQRLRFVLELRQRRKTARVRTTVTSQTSSFPKRHGICVILSRRLPSRREMPTGSLVAGMPANAIIINL